MTSQEAFNHSEVKKFNSLAHEWWDVNGSFATLHHINPLRIEYIKKYLALQDKTVLDVGCGGGILSEELAQNGAQVTAIDLASDSIATAKLHLFESNLNIDYQCVDLASLVTQDPKLYDAITCMEMLEHTDNPEAIIQSCAALLKTGGYAFFSTLNRNFKSYLLGIIAAEYILNLVPRGTHHYKNFIKPSTMHKMFKAHGLELVGIAGVNYNPFSKTASLSNDVAVNYLICARKI